MSPSPLTSSRNLLVRSAQSTSFFSWVIVLGSLTEKRNEDGTFPAPDWGVQANPVQTHELAQNEEQTNRFTGGATLTWEAVNADKQSFKFVAGGGMDVFDQVNTLWSPNEAFYEINQALPGTAIEGNGDSKFFNWNLNGIHVWRPGNWSATTSFGIQFEDRQLKTARATTVNLIPGQQNVGRGTTTTAFERLEQERTQAIYAQEEIRLFSDKLLVAGGVRAERSSVNGDVDKYYVFPKISGSYRFMDLLGIPTGQAWPDYLSKRSLFYFDIASMWSKKAPAEIRLQAWNQFDQTEDSYIFFMDTLDAAEFYAFSTLSVDLPPLSLEQLYIPTLRR